MGSRETLDPKLDVVFKLRLRGACACTAASQTPPLGVGHAALVATQLALIDARPLVVLVLRAKLCQMLSAWKLLPVSPCAAFRSSS
jgi:hypothetical protein